MDALLNDAEPGFGASTLALRGVTRTFGATRALDEINLDIPRGEITALVGHNGAGKSTLLRILSGADKPDTGTVLIGGTPVGFRGPSDALAHGVCAVYQELSLVPQLSIAQNMFLGHEETVSGFLDAKSMHRRARTLCDEFGIDIDVRTPLGELTVAHRQLAEVATAINRDAKFLLLDEPTTALEARQITMLLDTVRRISAERNIGVLLVNHKLDEVFAYANNIHVIANGRNILDGTSRTLTSDAVVDAIVGTHFEGAGSSAATAPSARGSAVSSAGKATTVLRVDGVTTKRLTGVNLSVHSGEVVGIYGLMGSGRTSFLRTLVGLHPVLSGAITLEGAPYRASSVLASMRRGVAYVSEERKIDGIVPNLNVFRNVGIAVVDDYTTAGFIHESKLIAAAKKQLLAMRTHGDLTGAITTLSGGNQQKALLARAILQRPRLLLLDEPTKGVDIGAKAEIHALIRQLADETGAGVLVVTSEEEEALTLADTIHVFQDGACSPDGVPAGELTIPELKSLAWLGADSSAGIDGTPPAA